METKITVAEYLRHKGELHRNESIYDAYNFSHIGWFYAYDPNTNNAILIKREVGDIVKRNIEHVCVEIECTPIYVAL